MCGCLDRSRDQRRQVVVLEASEDDRMAVVGRVAREQEARGDERRVVVAVALGPAVVEAREEGRKTRARRGVNAGASVIARKAGHRHQGVLDHATWASWGYRPSASRSIPM